MSTTDADQLQALKAQFDALLENRVGVLLGEVKAIQELTRRIAALEADIHRNQELSGPLRTEAAGLESDNKALRTKVDQLKDHVGKMRAMKKELMSNLTTLKSELE